MNRVFKTKWSVAHHEYVVTDEHHSTKTKANKSVVALAVASMMMLAGSASAAYVEPGFVATSSDNVTAAQKSWETEEYKKDWGLEAMHASKAYALGFYGQNTKVAIMDSGALLQKHPELAGDRFSATHVKGEYGMSGNRYPQDVSATNPGKPFEKGEKFEVTGEWMPNVNDNHGTHVVGTVGANRDGNEFHGVAWGSDILSSNTGATDNNNYGPFQDYDFFYAGWKATADNLAASNGEKRGGVINNSWGTNIRVQYLLVSYINDDGKLAWKGYKDKDGNYVYLKAGEDSAKALEALSKELGLGTDQTKKDNIAWGKTSLTTNTRQEAEYEYFFSKMAYEKEYAGTDHAGKSFVDAAYDAVKGTNVVQIFTTGNRNMDNPYYRPLYPYFNPEAEKHWIAVAGLWRDIDGSYKLEDGFNEAGLAKYWTVAAPGDNIYSTIVGKDPSITESKNPLKPAFGEPGYGYKTGTSMSAPHVAGAMGVLMSRYQDMSAIQVRDVMFTTANHYNEDKTVMEGWADKNGTIRKDGEVSDRMGWGVPDLDKGMYGPGQFLGKFDYDMSNTKLDVWSNNISNVALDQRRAEDEQWLKDYDKNLNADDYVLGEDWNVLNGTLDTGDHVVSKEDAKKWRAEYFAKRKAAIEAKLANGEYEGSLVKRGAGTLVMTGNNSYRGGTTVEGGKLLGFAESFGVTGDDAKASANGKVVVNGGTFGLLEKYNDQFTMKGELVAGKHDPQGQNEVAVLEHSVDVTVNKGGTFQITAGQSVTMGNLEFKDGAGFTVGSEDVDVLKEAYAGKDQKGTVTVDKVTGADLAVANPDYAFFKTELKADGNKLTGTLSRDKNASFATYAQNANGQAIAGALEAAGNGALYDTLIGASKGDVTKTYNSLGDDFVLNTRNAGIANGMLLARAVKDQAAGIGEGRAVEMGEGTARLWATGIGSKSTVDYGMSDMDSDFYAGLVGAEVDVADSTKVGVFFGAGSTENKATGQKAKSDDIHVGAYGVTNVNDFAASYGFVYSHLDADVTRSLQVGSQLGMNAFSGKTDLTQIFGEVAYKGLNTTGYSVEPYFGLSWIHAESDAFNEQVGNVKFATTPADQDVQVTTFGVRGALPFTFGSAQMAVKGDLAWNHLFGDTEAEAAMNLGGSAVANLKGGELGDMASVGLGLEAKVGKMTTMGVSYTGAYDGDITSHGVTANVRFNF